MSVPEGIGWASGAILGVSETYLRLLVPYAGFMELYLRLLVTYGEGVLETYF